MHAQLKAKHVCGIPELATVAYITDTCHVYPLNGKRILKRTYWYLIRSTAHKGLVAQAEEGITDVLWVNKFQLLKLMPYSLSLMPFTKVSSNPFK